MRTAGILLISFALTCAVISNAYYQKKQFYPSVVYITKSNPCMTVIYVQGFILVYITNTFLRKIFFGNLRAAELEHLVEKAWYAVTETCLAFTVFRDDFSPKFIALFTLLLFLKSFHWLAEDRVDYMERSPVITWLFHLRVTTLLTLLAVININMIQYAYNSTQVKGASVQLVFGFEYAILLTIVLNIIVKYMLHTADLRSEGPWENKPVFLLYTELIIGFFKVILYVSFVAIMVKLYALPLFAFRPMYYTMRNFKKAFQDIVMSQRAIRNMNTFYPDATPEELAAADNVCIICREEMVSASKKLPCNHIFHTACLRSWFQRQQTCPTCRLNILRPATGNTEPRPANQPQGPTPTPQPAQTIPNQQDAPAPRSIVEWRAMRNLPGSTSPPTPVPFFAPPFPTTVPLPPVPTPPPNLTTLSEDELRAMEGNLRQTVEARIQTLQRVQLLLDAANAMMNQYQMAAATANIPVPTTSGTRVVPESGSSKESKTRVPESHSPAANRKEECATSSRTGITSNDDVSTTSEGSNSSTDGTSLPSTSRAAGDEDVNSEQAALRKRRLQKFSVQPAAD
ncbi:E3 ubiquitin-protein ligase HRD1 [Venturia canescens]|uniref:E3 ubiquitin-protein ligase HRD1 n=1 Tax=Venturia canescens TaxID=32260 RepID=UPI001C9D33EF|nr:E3 ubiquitin-protein ligase HRD1 [Venturia canescens]